ncbi:ANTAR domain-containing protein [Nocardioides sp. zg-1308]|uniref:ANTAR domain-containing protein n=1 Tax=Nocardioides sp. zg-1308 TaxID=2736253 RepID=UPI00155800E9|nr:ANTAR domain-containing protein [Nocardioides sp. zg-1308]NPD04885.1 ANTAR domain-containing protein [Nocardioides sp. zg-1308]
MELLPQSREALDEYVAPSIDDVESLLRVIEGWAVRAVPECVALSVTLLDEDLTFTLVDPAARPLATVPGAGAPGAPPAPPPEEAHALDEGGWAEMARERAFAGIASTISLPVVEHGRAVLNIDLYASTAQAFHGRIDGLVDALGVWQAGAVTNADLGFDTLRRAEAAPERLREQRLFDVAVGLLAAHLGVTTEDALALLREAAERAGISETQAADVARTLLA